MWLFFKVFNQNAQPQKTFSSLLFPFPRLKGCLFLSSKVDKMTSMKRKWKLEVHIRGRESMGDCAPGRGSSLLLNATTCGTLWVLNAVLGCRRGLLDMWECSHHTQLFLTQGLSINWPSLLRSAGKKSRTWAVRVLDYHVCLPTRQVSLVLSLFQPCASAQMVNRSGPGHLTLPVSTTSSRQSH